MYENRAFRGMTPTTKFWMLMVQDGEGCDYTVGCGMCAQPLKAQPLKAQPLKAQTVEEARKEAEDFFTDRDEDGYAEGNHYINPNSEGVLAHVVLVTASEFLPLERWQREYMADRAKRAEEEQRQKDEAELKRLKAKLGK